MKKKIDTHILKINKLFSPSGLSKKYPITDEIKKIVYNTRIAIKKIINKKDDRLLVIVGPCSIHNIESAIEYANRLVLLRKKFHKELEVVMRVYCEKPRTTIGWKGLVNDPYINNTFKLNIGIKRSRSLLLKINKIGLPTACELLNTITYCYFSDLICWSAIGARTIESQMHREIASSLSVPIGFKNNINGEVKPAINAIKSAKTPNCFLSITKNGNVSIINSTGNPDSHIILRGGTFPNYKSFHIKKVKNLLFQSKLPIRLMIDCSHGNSKKEFKNQIFVCKDICKQLSQGDNDIIGIMLESFLKEGKQNIKNKSLIYGKSITDSCIGWKDTKNLLLKLADAVSKRRLRN